MEIPLYTVYMVYVSDEELFQHVPIDSMFIESLMLEEATKTLDEKFEARLAEAGLAKREEEAETTGPVEKVSGTPPVQKGLEEPETWESMVDKFNAGDISWEEMEPVQKQHDKEIGGSGMRG